jgi:pimeloyl-ACP methyl ester carboxylesterase
MRPRLRTVLLGALGVLVAAVVVLNWTYGRLPAKPARAGALAQVGNLRIRYLERPGRGTPVVLIHGLPGTAEDFERVVPLLAGHRTIAIDRPGFGYSTGGYVPFDRQLQVIHALLAELHVARPVLVGHSYGGTIALGYAERYPGAVRGLVLADAAAAGTHPGWYSRLQSHLLNILRAPVIGTLAHATFSQLMLKASAEQEEKEAFQPEPVIAAHRERVLSIDLSAGNLHALADERLAAGGVVDRVDAALRRIAVPAVVVQGDSDKLVQPRYGRRLARLLPHARLEMLHAGHMTPYTHPGALAAAVESVAAAAGGHGSR